MKRNSRGWNATISESRQSDVTDEQRGVGRQTADRGSSAPGRGLTVRGPMSPWVIMLPMPEEPLRGIVGMVPDEFKHEPRSKGLLTARKKKPKELAVITECCTGCAGSPACVEYCPVEDCMFWVPDEDNSPFGRIQVAPILCIGCNKCTSKGPDGSFLDGCPWDAIVMVDTAEVEKEVGVMPF